jgi:hypothetical protein
LKYFEKPLWDGCINHSKLSVVAQVFTIKVNYGLSEAGYDIIMQWARSILPEENKLKEIFHYAHFMMKLVSLGYHKINMCPKLTCGYKTP